MRIQMEKENNANFAQHDFICVASHRVDYNMISLQAADEVVYEAGTAASVWNVNSSKYFEYVPSTHIDVDVAVRLNRCALTRTIFERTSGTSYLKLNLDIIAYRHFSIFHRLHVAPYWSFLLTFCTSTTARNEFCVRFFSIWRLCQLLCCNKWNYALLARTRRLRDIFPHTWNVMEITKKCTLTQTMNVISAALLHPRSTQMKAHIKRGGPCTMHLRLGSVKVFVHVLFCVTWDGDWNLKWSATCNQ